MKATAIAPSNIAFTKYWGRKNDVLRLPENGSVSMCLSNMLTTTTVELSDQYKQDQIIINGQEDQKEVSRVIKHLNTVRKLANLNQKAKVVTENSFPTGTGLSSSASGFAALTVAACAAANLKLSEKELSILARQGSGSACRSIPSGFVEWLDGNSSETSYSTTIFPPGYWDLSDVVAAVSQGRKEISTSQAHESARSSPFLPLRVKRMKQKNEQVKKLIKEKDFTKFGEFIEAEALELHAIMITQTPPLIYLLPNTLLIFKLIHAWRKEDLEVYFTVNTGQDVHLICQQKDSEEVKNRLSKIEEVREIIVNTPSEGTKLSDKHLF